MKSTAELIDKRIKSKAKGTILFPADFTDLGTSEAIRLHLFRLEKEGLIKRISQGIYVRPRESKLLGTLTPSAEEVANSIAKRDRIRCIPTGSYALHALGLSTQVPMKIVLLTDGSSRVIHIGNRTITFKKTTPKFLLAKGKISGLVIQAVKEIGKDNMSPEEEQRILYLLKKESSKNLAHDITLAPVWIQKIMQKAQAHE